MWIQPLEPVNITNMNIKNIKLVPSIKILSKGLFFSFDYIQYKYDQKNMNNKNITYTYTIKTLSKGFCFLIIYKIVKNIKNKISF